MRILGISSIDSGCGFHRVTMPLGFMDDIEGFVTNLPGEETMAKPWDIVLFNRFSPFDTNFDAVRKQIGAKIVMDLDDDWDLPHSHINYEHYIANKTRLETNIMDADFITVSTERIYNKVLKLRKEVQIIPNGLPFGYHQYNDLKHPSNKVRIFWCGSVTHEKDIAILRNPIKRLHEFGDRIKMVLGGYSDSNEPSRLTWDKMLRYFTDNLSLPFQILKGMPPTKYMAMYENADIMVIPLEASPWHAAKSNLKILEAAAKKIPVIVSAVEPYILDKDAPVFWVHKQTDWYNHLKTLINDEEKRKQAGEDLFRWASGNYNLLAINNTRAECFRRIIKA